MGMEPMMISHPIRTSGSECGTLPTMALHHWLIIRVMSRQKYNNTANSVPICVMAVKAAPGSAAPGKNSPTTRKWAEDEIGKNSVSPWTMPRMIASIQFTWSTLRHSRAGFVKLQLVEAVNRRCRSRHLAHPPPRCRFRHSHHHRRSHRNQGRPHRRLRLQRLPAG